MRHEILDELIVAMASDRGNMVLPLDLGPQGLKNVCIQIYRYRFRTQIFRQQQHN